MSIRRAAGPLSRCLSREAAGPGTRPGEDPRPAGCWESSFTPHQRAPPFPIGWRLGRQWWTPDSTVFMNAPALLEPVLNQKGSEVSLSPEGHQASVGG